ncbi:hypothetical protein O8C79_11830 [Aliarcobacter butzleri]|uniref:hypothetical protein n=1 Tax=Aliarcobacter butzleri TaxID=28197 RepID=UPI00263D40B7|nr:hypothetical protein [Aliarcobacter butzleri]MDN5105991.1 hypothetical protein [Aliarcobacter butzleri]
MHTKDYLNQEIKEEIEKKGFSIYNYISLKELLLTVNKDYLATITTLNIAFMFIFMGVGFLSYFSKNYEYFIYLFIYVYSLIFIYLILKLLFRTYKFSQITNILYTKKGLIIGKEVFHYETDKDLKNLLLDYEKLFDEYLSKSSKLSENIDSLREKLSNKLKENYSSLGRGDDIRAIIVGFILITIYNISVFIFYYLGFILGFFIFFIFSFFINLYFKINKSVELKIKENMQFIDKKIKKLDEIYLLLSKQISTFQDGEIFNLSNKIDKDMNKFYENINTLIL